MRLPRLVLALMLILWLAGCATGSGSPERYTLPAGSLAPGEDGAETLDKSPRRTLILEGVELASFLESQGIILQSDDIRLREASSHLWAEALNRQLDRGLRQRLANRLPGTRILGSGDKANALHLSVNVDQFQGRYDGMAVASGRWQLRDDEGELLAFETFDVTAPLESDGYPALVRALGRAWDRVAEKISAGIEAEYP